MLKKIRCMYEAVQSVYAGERILAQVVINFCKTILTTKEDSLVSFPIEPY